MWSFEGLTGQRLQITGEVHLTIRRRFVHEPGTAWPTLGEMIRSGERLLIMLDQYYACTVIYAAAFAVNVTLCVVLIPHIGPVGAAVSMATALTIESALLFFVTKRRLGYHIFVFARPRSSRGDA